MYYLCSRCKSHGRTLLTAGLKKLAYLGSLTVEKTLRFAGRDARATED